MKLSFSVMDRTNILKWSSRSVSGTLKGCSSGSALDRSGSILLMGLQSDPDSGEIFGYEPGTINPSSIEVK